MNFKSQLDQRRRAALAVAQVGLAFRDEIRRAKPDPRARVHDDRYRARRAPAEREHSKLEQARDYLLTLSPSKTQLATGMRVQMAGAGAAVAGKVIASETLAFLPVPHGHVLQDRHRHDMARLRFRQLLPTEMAHSSDCWDGEACKSFGWVECVRRASARATTCRCTARTKVDLTAIRRIEPPEQRA
jgi:glycyl-tRNA synthetase (class II)